VICGLDLGGSIAHEGCGVRGVPTTALLSNADLFREAEKDKIKLSASEARALASLWRPVIFLDRRATAAGA